MSGEDAKAAGLYEVIGEEIDDKYMEALKKLVLRPEAIKEQELPDGDFPTVSYPNPEDKNAFTLALKLAKEVDTDIATGGFLYCHFRNPMFCTLSWKMAHGSA